jgi:hypothetical protein
MKGSDSFASLSSISHRTFSLSQNFVQNKNVRVPISAVSPITLTIEKENSSNTPLEILNVFCNPVDD